MPSRLFESVTQRSITFRNRIGISPMCQYSSDNGHANDWHLVHLGTRATGGAGLIITEATAVEARGRISPFDLGIYLDSHIDPLARITTFLKQHGAVPGIQLAHAGRKASTSPPWTGGKSVADADGGWTPVAPSPLPFSPDYRTPTALEHPATIVAAFKLAAERALDAGFELIELHAAHGYLMHEFHSPIANHRTDTYGGSFENRTRLTREVVAAVRSVLPEKLPLWIRFSCTDYLDNGWTLDDSVRLATLLRSEGVDAIDCSSGGIAPHVKIPVAPGYQVPFAARIRAEANIATAAVGLITTPRQAEDILASNHADFVLLARESLRDPNFPHRAALELAEKPKPPAQYERAY